MECFDEPAPQSSVLMHVAQMYVPVVEILKKESIRLTHMTHYSEEERRLLFALAELEAAPLEHLALVTGLPAERIKRILKNLANRGMVDESSPD